MSPPNSPQPMNDQDRDITATVLRERARLGNFILRRVRDQDEADDILQDVFQEFVQACRLPAPIEQASAWLFRVARNRIIDRFRKKKELSVNETGDDPDDPDGEYRLDLVLPAPDGPAEVVLVEHLGSENFLHLLVAQQKLVTLVPPGERWHPGARARVTLRRPLCFDTAGQLLVA